MQEQHTPRKTCPIAKCNHRVKRTKLLVGHLEKKHGIRYEGKFIDLKTSHQQFKETNTI
jgi:hypothetical protein